MNRLQNRSKELKRIKKRKLLQQRSISTNEYPAPPLKIKKNNLKKKKKKEKKLRTEKKKKNKEKGTAATEK